MNLLLDAHALLWFIDGDSRLSLTAKAAIEDASNVKWVSVASLWEMAIKVCLGRLTLARPFEALIPSQLQINGFSLLAIDVSHLARTLSLPFHHRDPFDRVLAAQCLVEGLSVVSVDAVFDAYSVPRCW
jgi:PIN domain nuclease of toxin-antitoxin system